MGFRNIDRFAPSTFSGDVVSKQTKINRDLLTQARVIDNDNLSEKQQQLKKERRQLLKRTGMIVAGAAGLWACDKLGITPDVTVPTKEPTMFPTTKPTTEPTLKPEMTATPDLNYEGGQVELEELLKNPDLKENYDYLKGWFKFWSEANSTRMHYSFKPDADNSKTGVFVIESEDYPGKMILPPVYSWGPLTPPPTPLNGGAYDIDIGNGPLQLSYEISNEVSSATGITAGASVVYRDSQWGAEIVGQDGKPVVVGKINEKTGMWEKVEQPSLIEGDIFQDPQTKEEFATLVESPSPLDNPEEFAKWQDEYLRLIDEKLKTYDGSIIDAHQCAVDLGGQKLQFRDSEWGAVASYKFNWHGQEILTKTYVVKNANGVLTLFSITYTTEDSPIFLSTSVGYRSPAKEERVLVYYSFDNEGQQLDDPFIEEFLDDNISQANAWVKYGLNGLATNEEMELAKDARFVMIGAGR
jgi:hypothetical protein